MRTTIERSTPVYIKIRQSIFSRFSQLSALNECIPSENELCKYYKVSRSTIRKALKDLIKEEYLIPRPGKGTFINIESLKNSFHPMATQIGYTSSDGKTSFFTLSDGKILCGAMEFIHEQGKLFLLINLINTGEKAVDELTSMSGIKGLIWFNPTPPHYETIRQAEKAGLPIVTVYKSSDEFDWVGIDQFEVGRLAAEYLIKKGCRRIIETYIDDDEEAHERMAGIAHSFKEHGIQYDGKLRLYDKCSIAEELSKMISYGVQFDGIFSIGTFLPTIMDVLQKNEMKIPQDVNLISVYSSGYQFVGDHTIPVIRLPYGECGKVAAQELLKKINNANKEKVKIKLKPEIIDS